MNKISSCLATPWLASLYTQSLLSVVHATPWQTNSSHDDDWEGWRLASSTNISIGWKPGFYKLATTTRRNADWPTQHLACLGDPADMDEEADAEGEEPDDIGDEDDA